MNHRRDQFPAFGPPRAPVMLIGALLVLGLLLGAGVATVAGKTIVCAYDTDCSGTKKADTIRGEGRNTLHGKGGNDSITASEFSSVYAGAGDDKIRAFAGGTILEAGNGNDVVNSINGEYDDIDCGPGKDKVLYDAGLDVPVNCEDRHPR